ncbi:MAG: carbon-nitrogen family hydrolase [Acidaminococcaceae bacterium]|jgi:predicted amidohydrolase|nr:carbon-nitrogen family hydrolase [Acidaminococcaceae bacterium]
MKASVIQMNMQFEKPTYNFQHAEELICKAAQEKPDVILLPETWNTGFFPVKDLSKYCDHDGEKVKEMCSALSKKFDVNIIAGSISNLRSDGKVYNTAYVFNRAGECIADYDKTHVFTPMGEDKFYQLGTHITTFELDGHKCGIIICYDVRFLELVRTLALQNIEVLFIPAQWPAKRRFHWTTLTTARAIENQMFVVTCNSCGTAGETVYGGSSRILDPWGETIAAAGEQEEIITGELDFSVIKNIRETINVYRDRRPELYKIK